MTTTCEFSTEFFISHDVSPKWEYTAIFIRNYVSLTVPRKQDCSARPNRHDMRLGDSLSANAKREDRAKPHSRARVAPIRYRAVPAYRWYLLALINFSPSVCSVRANDEKDRRGKRKGGGEKEKKKGGNNNVPSLNKSLGVTVRQGRLTSAVCRSIRYVELTRDRNEAPRIGY